MKLAKMLIGAVAVSALYAGPANALKVLNWDQARAQVPTGTLSFDGVRLTGTNISFDLMDAFGTGATDGVYHCSDAGGNVALGQTPCLLSFQTGTLQQVVGNVYIFNPGGSISMSGWLSTATPGNSAPTIADDPLVLSGRFQQVFVFDRGSSALGTGAGWDLKDDRLDEYFGVEPDSRWSFAVTTISLSGCTQGDTFTCDVTQADFQNKIVPEPATLALMGLGLLGVVAARRRRA